MNIDGFSPASAFASGNINTSVLGNNANAANAGITGNASDALKDNLKTAFGDTLGQVKPSRECQTCKNRKYQDGSNEMVSFKSAAHISPNAAGTAVRACFPSSFNPFGFIPAVCLSLESAITAVRLISLKTFV